MSEEKLNHYKEWIEDNEEIVVDSSIFEELVKEIEKLNKLKERYQLEKEVLKQRIDKAIEYIEKVKDMYTVNEVVNQAGIPILDISIEIWKKELLDILKGADKE